MEAARFGNLVVKEYAYRKDGRDFWHCICDCGNETVVKQCNLKSGNSKSCGCKKRLVLKPALPRTEEQLKNYFYSFRKPETECWIFTKYLLKGGYGSITWKGKPWIASRLAWTIFNGEIPKRVFVCHKCDVRNCVNPDHLFLGTKQDNMNDMVQKGRSLVGIKNPNCKVTEEFVREIRNVHTEYSIAELARIFSLSEGCLRHIIKYRAWKHI